MSSLRNRMPGVVGWHVVPVSVSLKVVELGVAGFGSGPILKLLITLNCYEKLGRTVEKQSKTGNFPVIFINFLLRFRNPGRSFPRPRDLARFGSLETAGSVPSLPENERSVFRTPHIELPVRLPVPTLGIGRVGAAHAEDC